MNRFVHSAFARCLQIILALGVAIAPVAHALDMPVLSKPTDAPAGQAVTMPCHSAPASRNDAQAMAAAEPSESDTGDTGNCCCKKGSVCHCAMSIALPATFQSMALSPAHDYDIAFSTFSLGNLPPPEPPPPRG